MGNAPTTPRTPAVQAGKGGLLLRLVEGLSRNQKLALLTGVDFLLLCSTFWAAFAVRLGTWAPWPELRQFWWLLPLLAAVRFPVFVRLGLYRAVLRESSGEIGQLVMLGVGYSLLGYSLPLWILAPPGFPRSVVLIEAALAIVACTAIRDLARHRLLQQVARVKASTPVFIYGAGSAGGQLARALRAGEEYLPVAFVDDSPVRVGEKVAGYRVYQASQIQELAARFRTHQVLLAIPSLKTTRRQLIVADLEQRGFQVKSVPGLLDLVGGHMRIQDVTDVGVEDLLGREAVPPDEGLIRARITRRVVMVTGAGGSIGSELCRQVAALDPCCLVVFERNEFALYKILMDLEEAFPEVRIESALGSVLDSSRLVQTMRRFDVQTVYHAAAYKHVPLVEKNPCEGVRNNVFGTLRCAEASLESGVETFVLISTDKAVRPCNVMGASKRAAELVCSMLAERARKMVQRNGGKVTRLVIVRFGNVLDSAGSVLPLFRKQIAKGVPLTVTHPNVTRFFMTIPEAAQLVIQASSLGEGGEVFVLEMGKPIKILDLARTLIRLSHGENSRDPGIRFIGLRPGEKLHEELLLDRRKAEATEHPKIVCAREESPPGGIISLHLKKLDDSLTAQDAEQTCQILSSLVEGYRTDVPEEVPQRGPEAVLVPMSERTPA